MPKKTFASKKKPSARKKKTGKNHSTLHSNIVSIVKVFELKVDSSWRWFNFQDRTGIVLEMVSSQPKLTKYVDPHYDYHQAKLLTQKSLKSLKDLKDKAEAKMLSVDPRSQSKSRKVDQPPLNFHSSLLLGSTYNNSTSLLSLKGAESITRIYNGVQPTVSSSAK